MPEQGTAEILLSLFGLLRWVRHGQRQCSTRRGKVAWRDRCSPVALPRTHRKDQRRQKPNQKGRSLPKATYMKTCALILAQPAFASFQLVFNGRRYDPFDKY
jgi:hypothetical protein